MWENGLIGGYRYSIKHYETPSPSGLEGSKISKLDLIDGETNEIVASYDRGWDVKPTEPEHERLIGLIVNRFL
ncbi:hypothetical protein I6N96_12680 [Enterococcus sp. BWM-S5]|uniref:DUF7678 domain-containing protein n=1 Tax=Enterococcus larvae TaxID=2794352 RepID=A0ABS4CKK7_9ENTE|nr:hypothetical protein [Enterococcus larvae]MBP1047129.1 hypothetical protein [Enterococcus larvae]